MNLPLMNQRWRDMPKQKPNPKPPKPPRHRPLTIAPELMEAFGEMDLPDNRTCAVVSAALVENYLALAILSRLREMNTEEQDHMFEGRDLPLADFAAKIDLGYALNIYGTLVRDDLDQIRHIRNRFAHNLRVRDFDHEEVAPRCDRLNGPRYLDRPANKAGQPLNRRDRFVETATHLAARFSHEIANVVRPPPSINRVGADY